MKVRKLAMYIGHSEAVGDQLNKPAYRFLERLICCAIEEATGLEYVDEVGYDLVTVRVGSVGEISTFYKTKDC